MKTRVFWVSALVFVILNTIENLLHYSIGRMKDRHSYQLRVELPSLHDLTKILFIMIVFATLQGAFTYIMD